MTGLKLPLMVLEAMQLGARAIKENKNSVEYVDLCSRDLQESIDSQKEVEKALVTTAEQTPLYTDIEDEDIEEELNKLELAVGKEAQAPAPEKAFTSAEGRTTLEATEVLDDAFSNLKLSDSPASAGKLKIT